MARSCWFRTMSGAARWLALAALLLPAGVRGQGAEVAELCGRVVVIPDDLACETGGQGLLIAQPRLLLAQAGGNPVPGTASTLGMRLGTMPRWALGGRLTGVGVGDLPRTSPEGVVAEAARAVGASADLTVGVLPGFSPAPTVGGLLSLDVLASGGLVFLAEDDGFRESPVFGWAVGLRLGILRESFTLPGISVTGMYRDLGQVSYRPPGGSPWRSEARALTLRGAISKDVLGFGVAAGAGIDRLSADVSYSPEGITRAVDHGLEDLVDTRTLAFGSLSYSLLVAHLALEAGWQEGADEVPGAEPAAREAAGSGGWYGTLALRLSI